MKQLLTVLAFLCIITCGQSFQAQALTFDHLPKSQTSNQWKVQVGEAKPNKDSVNPKKGEFDTYSFYVKNIGKNVDSVTVQAFRDEPNSQTKFALFSNETNAEIQETGQDFNFTVFPLSVKAKQLEIVVTWKEKGIDRELKETFVFKQ